MKKAVKIVFILICFAAILFALNSSIYAAASFDTTPYEKVNQTEASDVGELQNIGNIIIGIIRTVGSIASVGVLIVLGIKYMAASLEERAQYKKSMIPYVVGAVLVFGITNLLAIIIDIAKLF